VTASVEGTALSVRRLTMASTMPTPADGPSFLTAPEGRCNFGDQVSPQGLPT
jgi:hypothetical protein